MSMEGIKEFETFITTVGFPIVMCWLMWKKITDSDEKQTALINELIGAINSLSEYIKGGSKHD